MLLSGNIIEELKRKAYTYFINTRVKQWQKPVVIPLPPAKTMTILVESHSRDYRHVDSLVVGEQPATWLHNPESAFPQVVITSIFAQHHLSLSRHLGQHHRLSLIP